MTTSGRRRPTRGLVVSALALVAAGLAVVLPAAPAAPAADTGDTGDIADTADGREGSAWIW